MIRRILLDTYKLIFSLYSKIISVLLIPIFSRESKENKLRPRNERPIEYSFLFSKLYEVSPKTILDIGSGASSLPHLLARCGFDVTATDEKGNYWGFDYFNRHYPILKDDILNSKIEKKFDLITCISVIEHIPNHEEAMKGICNLLKSEGYLIISFPFNKNSYIKNVYELESAGYGQNSPFICQIFSQNEINKWIDDNNCKIIEQEYYQVFNGNLWTFGERIFPPVKVDVNDESHLTCLLIKKID